jgi:hypothetical protein
MLLFLSISPFSLSLEDAAEVSSYELIHVFRAQASPFVVFASQPELRVDIVVANWFAGLVHVNQRSMHLKQRDHLVHASSTTRVWTSPGGS